MTDVFPETTVVCCDTHFKHSLRKVIQQKHLQTAYNTSVGLQTLVRYLWSLSLVPVDDDMKVWDNFVVPSIPQDAPEH